MYKVLLSLRYFRSRFLTLASLLAITFGVAMLVIVLGIMGGYHVRLQEHLRGQEAHLQIRGPTHFGITRFDELEELLLGVDGVRAVAPFVEQLGVYHSGLSFRPCLLVGIDPVAQSRVADLARYVLRPAELDAIVEEHIVRAAENADSVARATRTANVIRAVDEVIGNPARPELSLEEVASFFDRPWRKEVLERSDPERYEALAGQIPQGVLVGLQFLIDREMAVGDIITFVTMDPEGESPQPLDQDFVVVGALKTGDFEQDSGTIYADIDAVRNWLPLWDEETGRYYYQGVRIAIRDPDQLESMQRKVEKAIEKRFPLYTVRTWKDLRRNLLKAVAIEKFLVYFIVLVLVVFTGSMILLMLLLTVIEKTRDVGVLLSLGATPWGVTSIFLWNGLVICIAGIILGLGGGFAFCWRINEIHDAIQRVTGITLFNPEIYHMDRIPIAFEPWDILLSTIPPVCIGFFASLVPAIWAPRRDPIKSIQYE